MVYTIGYTKSYLKNFEQYKENPKGFMKMGRRESFEGKFYPGGCIFKSFEDALNYLATENLIDYSVFGVLADWVNDTDNTGEVYNNLLIDAQLVNL